MKIRIESIVIVLLIGAMQPIHAALPVQPKTVQVLIPPECKAMFYGPDWVDVDASGTVTKTEKREKPDYLPWDPARAKSHSYKDSGTSITFYVESDGRHLAAIDSAGKLLWVRNPFEDRHMCPYRTPRPVIVHIEAANPAAQKNGLKVEFDSSQFGVVDEATGDFVFAGQN
jgi:hypothetical protein